MEQSPCSEIYQRSEHDGLQKYGACIEPSLAIQSSIQS